MTAHHATRKAAVTADTSSKEEPRAALSSLSPRERALSVLRASVLDELIAFEGLVARRDAAFERYHSRAKPLGKGSAVKISPSKIVTSRGFTPDKIRLRIKLAKRASDLSYMRKQIAELRKKVKGDLVIVKRMSTS